MTPEVPDESFDRYLGRAIHGERALAVEMTLELLADGVSREHLIVDLLAAAQCEVGERWFRNELTVADEHLATGVSHATLGALIDDDPPIEGDGHTVVACAEGDWHSLAAEMFGDLLRAQGCGVSVLGASVPADSVAEFLALRHADSLAVSCTLPTNFLGVTRLVDAAHRVECPVIVGGRALGSDAGRAERLGADGWAGSASDAASLLARWRVMKPPIAREAVALPPQAVSLSERAVEIATDAFAGLAQPFPSVVELDRRQRARMLDDLVFVVESVAAALLTEDDSVFDDEIGWLHGLMLNWGRPPDGLLAGLALLRPAVEEIDLHAARLLDSGRRVLGRRVA